MGFFTALFPRKPVIGMLHLFGRTETERMERALDDAAVYARCGVHAVIVENYFRDTNLHDLKTIATTLRDSRDFDGWVGVNVLPNDYASALTMAGRHALPFVQLDLVAGKYRRWDEEIDLQDYDPIRVANRQVCVLGGVWTKGYDASKNPLAQDIRNGLARADAIVVTGHGTGMPTPLARIEAFRAEIDAQGGGILVQGAGSTLESLACTVPLIDGVIVGSAFKNAGGRGDVRGPVLYEKVAPYMDEWRRLTA